MWLSIAGAVIPYVFFTQHFAEVGIGLPDFVASLFANPAASGFTADLLITSVAFWVYMFQRKSREGSPAPLPFMVANLAIGLSCALPACLYFMERRHED
ncbi:MAG: DUF2834 domain-containing protein [bacterium]